MSFQVSPDGVEYYDLYQNGAEVTRPVVAGKASVVPAELTVGAFWVKIRSGQSGHEQRQDVERKFQLVLI